MSNICSKVTIDKNWSSQNFSFPILKNQSPCKFWESSNSLRYYRNLYLLVANLKPEISEKENICFSCYFNFEKNSEVSNSISLFFLFNEKLTFNKNETEPEMEISQNKQLSFRMSGYRDGDSRGRDLIVTLNISNAFHNVAPKQKISGNFYLKILTKELYCNNFLQNEDVFTVKMNLHFLNIFRSSIFFCWYQIRLFCRYLLAI